MSLLDIQRLTEERYDLPAGLLSALMKVESAGKADAVSPKGARGLYQFMPGTASELGIDPLDPIQSTEGAGRYMRSLLDQTGDLSTALAAYNWGIGNVQRKGLSRAPAETRAYVPKVLSKLQGGESDETLAGGAKEDEIQAVMRELEAKLGRARETTAPTPPEAATTPPATVPVSEVEPLVRTLSAKLGRPEPEPIAKPEQPSPLVSLGRGALDIGQGLWQLGLQAGEKVGMAEPGAADRYTQGVSEDIRLYEQGRGPDAGMDWWRVGGQAGATAPLMLVPGGQTLGMTGRAAIGAAEGAASGGALFAENAQDRAGNVLGGAVGGAAGTYIASGLSALASKGMNLARQAVRTVATWLDPSAQARMATAIAEAAARAGKSFDELPEQARKALMDDATAQLRLTGQLDPDALARKLDMEAFGLQPTTGQVTRSPTQWARERNLSKLDLNEEPINPLAERFGAQNEALKRAGRELAEGAGPAAEPGQVGRFAQRVAEMRARLSQRVVGKAYQKAGETMGAEHPIPVDTQAREAWDTISNTWENEFKGPLSAIKRRVDEMLGEESDRLFTPGEVDKTIKLINQRYGKTTDKAAREAMDETRRYLTDTLEVYGKATSEEAAEAFSQARRIAAERFKMLRPKYVADLLDNKTPAEDFVVNNVIGGRLDELRKLTGFFGNATGKNWQIGNQVLSGVRRQVDEWLYGKATGKAGEVFSGTNYMDALEQLGREKLEVLFGKAGAARRFQLGRAAKAATTTPAGAPVNWSNTAPTLVSYLSRVSQKVPLLGGATEFFMGMAKTGREAAEEAARRQQVTSALGAKWLTPEAEMASLQAQRRLRDILMGHGLLPGAAGLLTIEANQ